MIRCVGILITIMFLIVGKVKYKTWANPLVIFNAAWLMIFWAYGYSQVFGVYQPTEIAQSIVFYGVLSVNVGMMLMQRKIKFDLNRWHRDTYGGDTEYVMQPMLMKICAGVALLLVLFGSIGAIRALIGGASFSDIRSSYFTGSTGVSQLKYYLEEYIGGPLQYVAITGAIIGIINTTLRYKPFSNATWFFTFKK